jgi:hypothetical protein
LKLAFKRLWTQIIRKIDELFSWHVDNVTENFKQHVGIMTEDFQHKLDIVVEGQQILAGKIDRMDARLGGVEGFLLISCAIME